MTPLLRRKVASESSPFRKLLSGGDRRSLGKSNRVVALVLQRPQSFGRALRCLWDDHPIVRMRAADAALVARNPG